MTDVPVSAKNEDDILKLIKDNNITQVGFTFTDLRGKQQITYQSQATLDKDLFKDGLMMDGSSIAGWKDINESDMQLIPDKARLYLDPFTAQPTLKIFCDVFDPITKTPYNRCPRGIAKKAEAHLKSSGIADTAYFGPEAEFFVFDNVRVHSEQNHVSYFVDSREGPYNSGRDYPDGNTGHRPKVKGGYFPEAPVDQFADLRAEMVTAASAMGVEMEKHHHEVAPSQCELGMKFGALRACADNLQLYKYAVHNVAEAYGMTATFMPKPIFGDNGSGMHCHQSLFKGSTALFAGKDSDYAGLSETALYYIGGIIKHAKALNAFTNPTTNSYKRLVPGYEAPVLLAYSARNRSASCRIPMVTNAKARRIEVRFPDPLANPYLAFSSMLMAGLDGIKNKIHPGEAMDKNLYDLPEKELKKIPTVCGSLRQALENLQADHKFLLDGGVFDEDVIEAYIQLKMEEVETYETMPHPIEFKMYYSS
ncbi:MAG: type I glutamate--ammonia ligase [Rhodospirillales bacterium]|nr:type I glutamate--ammonia ligase [Rhodospirillales bacterium]MCB9980457.1 type I glutamate--ammonia ligase [Rhodospirillales bacterium]